MKGGMLMNYPYPLQNLIENMQQLPGIGPKTAERMALYIVTKLDEQTVLSMAQALISSKRDLTTCQICGNISQEIMCSICKDKTRDQSIICVVEEAKDVIVFEKMGMYKGLYHVLGGILSPLDGIGPEDLKIIELLERIKQMSVSEIILATSPNLEGEATAQYLQSLLVDAGIVISRIAHGVPVGSDLEYAGEATLMKALEGRRTL